MLDQTAHNPVPTVYAAIELSRELGRRNHATGQASPAFTERRGIFESVIRCARRRAVANDCSYVTKQVTTVSGWHVY